jgi:hypothetical protein
VLEPALAISAMTSLRLDFSTPCSWKAWRVVARKSPWPYLLERSSSVRKSEAGTSPTGTLSRSINWYDKSRSFFFLRSRFWNGKTRDTQLVASARACVAITTQTQQEARVCVCMHVREHARPDLRCRSTCCMYDPWCLRMWIESADTAISSLAMSARSGSRKWSDIALTICTLSCGFMLVHGLRAYTGRASVTG